MKAGLGLVLAGLAMAVSMSAAPEGAVEGNPGGPVRVLIYEDLQCGDCARFEVQLEEKLLPRYGSKVAFIHRDFPLGKHDWARPAAMAARWVWEQNSRLGLAIRREMMSEQNNINAQNLKLWLTEFATRNGLNSTGIIEALNDKRIAAEVDQDLQGGTARGVAHTPTVYVGGQAFVETIVYEDLARAIDEALAK
jgi:protein-disulfide isomerase